MARLPNSDFLIQSAGTWVSIFDPATDRVLVSFNAADMNDVAKSQGKIAHLEELDQEDKSFAHFWSGYFYAHLAP